MTGCGECIVQSIQRVFVVFADETSLWWLRLLKKGFRHCYILFEVDDMMTWVELNPMSNKTFISVYKYCSACNLAALKAKTSIVCEIDIVDVGLNVAPFSWFSCVEEVKRIAGIHSKFTITPYQLYKKLKIVGKKS